MLFFLKNGHKYGKWYIFGGNRIVLHYICRFIKPFRSFLKLFPTGSTICPVSLSVFASEC
jgi:hypothetical protein